MERRLANLYMNKRIFIALFAVIWISGCVVPPGGGDYQSPSDELSALSISHAQEYASDTNSYYLKNGEEKTIAAAKAVVKQSLKDPDSAKFQNVRVVDYNDGKVVCGEVNAKNSYGGYVGYASFVAGVLNAKTYDTSSQYEYINEAANAGIVAACGY